MVAKNTCTWNFCNSSITSFFSQYFLFSFHSCIVKSSEDEKNSLERKKECSPYLTQPSDSDEECQWADVDVGIDFRATSLLYMDAVT
jgi:hypothetical protein